MLIYAILGAALAVAFVAFWYGRFVRWNRKHGQRVLRWLQGSIADYGQIRSVDWISPSHLCARLSLSGEEFRQPVLYLRLAPRQNPLRWLLWHLRRRQETLTFQANLSCPPGETLEIGRLRWSAHSQRSTPPSVSCSTYPVATLFISTQPACPPQLSGRINGVVTTRNFDSLAVSFRPSPPHFSATFSLQEALGHPSGELPIVQSLRELAQGSPTSRM